MLSGNNGILSPHRGTARVSLPSYWLFHEKITWKAIVGAFISVVGVSLFFLG